MNARTQIAMDPEMQRRAEAKAAELGISFAEYVRGLVAGDLGKPNEGARAESTGGTNSGRIGAGAPNGKLHVSAIFDLVDDGEPTDIARDKDS